MISISPRLVFIDVSQSLVVGMLIGVVAGAVFAAALGLRVQGLLKDAMLGAAGFTAAFVATLLAHYGTDTEIAFFAALLLPLARQLLRLRQQDSAKFQ